MANSFEKITQRRNLIFTFFLCFSLLLVACHLSAFNSDIPDVSLLSTALAHGRIFRVLLVEFFLVGFLIFSLIQKNRFLRISGYIIVSAYCFIGFSQATSLMLSGEYISRLAFANKGMVGLGLNFRNLATFVSLVFGFTILPYFLSRVILKKVRNPLWIRNFSLSVLFVLLVAVVGLNQVQCFSSEARNATSSLLYNNNLKAPFSPVQSFVEIFSDKSKALLYFSDGDRENILKFGFLFDLGSKFPFQKQTGYQSSNPYRRKSGLAPNIILIFTEGLSARTTGVYSDKFRDLTPNLLEFSKSAMVVENYFNHTAATYAGIQGQICSMFPKYEGDDGWDPKLPNLDRRRYRCLPSYLRDEGYESVFLNVHSRNFTHIGAMMRRLGFESVMDAEDLRDKYLSPQEELPRRLLTDHQLYRSLLSFLKEREAKKTKPFFLSMYSAETHAWFDVLNDGKKYRNGESNSLNTIFNMDHAFGEFWSYFKRSPYAANTLVIFTSDHAHFYEKSFVDLMRAHRENDYRKLFIDKVPLLVFDPRGSLPKKFDAGGRNSLDLAPTILHYLSMNIHKNAMFGRSLFEPRDSKGFSGSVAAIGEAVYLIDQNRVLQGRTEFKDQAAFDSLEKFILFAQEYEAKGLPWTE